MKTIIFTGAALVLCLLSVMRSGSADEPEKKSESPFAGKLVSITVRNQNVGACLEKVEIRKLGSHDFLVGTGVAADERYTAMGGIKQWIAVDAILSIYEYKDLEEMKASFKRAAK